jgi:hypothetical protein
MQFIEIIINYTFGSLTLAEHKAEKCGCRNCLVELLDAQDRVNWLGYGGRWENKTPIGEIRRGKNRLVIYRDGTLVPDD